ncbi:hypothetical protein JW949_00370 [Candidatus Woesearchaeota archaeon]|nr:hypothetical protein [Candidatus Woesearchaeota archaeon]
MAKSPEAHNRLFENMFVCKKCKTKIKANIQSIKEGKIKCRNCNSKKFRPLKRK